LVIRIAQLDATTVYQTHENYKLIEAATLAGGLVVIRARQLSNVTPDIQEETMTAIISKALRDELIASAKAKLPEAK
jgi:hypothetical protein